jgi:hypothetical protein
MSKLSDSSGSRPGLPREPVPPWVRTMLSKRRPLSIWVQPGRPMLRL